MWLVLYLAPILTSKNVNHRDLSMQICLVKSTDYSGVNNSGCNTCVEYNEKINIFHSILHSPLQSSIIRFTEQTKIKKSDILLFYVHICG